MKKSKKLPKPRNEFVAGMRFRKSGAHTKTTKAKRKLESQKFAKEVSQTYD